MKKTIIIFLQILLAYCCYGQSIDTTALGILQKSYDKLAAMNSISYRLTKADTMMREGSPLRAEEKTVWGTIKKNVYWHLRFNDGVEWLIRNDTLYKKKSTALPQITFTNSRDAHSLATNSIYNILGINRPVLSTGIASLQFVKDSAESDYYIIDIVSKKRDYGTDEIQGILYFNRYWVNKKGLFCERRMMYAKRMENGREAIDIYDFSASLDKVGNTVFDSVAFFKIQPIIEKDTNKSIATGAIAPSFKVSEVRTGKQLILAELKGKVVLLDFWYLSCMPCRILTPKIQALHQKFSGENVAIIGINITDTSSADILKFLKDRKISFPQYYKTGQLATDYKLYAAPTTMILDRNGRVKHVEVGAGEDTIEKLEQVIRKELSNR